MKNLLQIVLVLMTIASLGYGYYQSTERSRLESLVELAAARVELAATRAEQATIRAEQAEMEARRQMAIAAEHQAQVEKTLAECQERRR